MLSLRILTACILIPLVLLIIFFAPPLVYQAIVALVLLIAGWEWSRLIGLLTLTKQIIYLLVLLLVFWGCGFVPLYVPIEIVLGINFFFWLGVFYFVLRYSQFERIWQYKWLRLLTGLWLFANAYIALLLIRALGGAWLLLILLLIVWISDTAAYFIGKKWGRHKLVPQISPGKTWQGFIGATVTILLMSLVTLYWAPFNERPLLTILLFIITSWFSVLGDLFESMVKRQAQIKDSGHWLPGHGGLLDRIDSLLAAAPCFSLGIFLLWFIYQY